MKRRDNSGLTMVELLIGFFLIVSVSIIFFQTIHSFKKETSFTSENFLASSLIEKVLEQCYQESELNLHGMKAIGLTDPDGKLYSFSTFITDRETVFFANPAITGAETPNLHKTLKDNFNLKIDGEKKTGFYEISAGFNWKAQSGRGQATSNTRILSFTGDKEVLTTLDLNDTKVKERLVKDIFNSPGAALEGKVSSSGAQKLLLSMGYVYYSSKDWLNSSEFKDRYEKAKSLEAFSQPGSEEFSQCSRLYFEMARDLLHLMISLKPMIEDTRSNMSFLASVPKPEKFIVESRIQRGGLFVRQLRRIFFNCLIKVAQRYEQQLKNSDTQRIQRQIVVRLFNINRILYANQSFSEEMTPTQISDNYKKFLDTVLESFRESDPAIFRMADQEQDFINKNSLKENFFILKLTNELFTAIDQYVDILDQPTS